MEGKIYPKASSESNYTFSTSGEQLDTNIKSVGTRNFEVLSVKRLKWKEEKIAEELKNLREVLDIAKSLKYSPGDVVFHKGFGNGIINDICISGGHKIDAGRRMDLTHTGYIVRFAQHDMTFVEEKELLPYNHAVEVLYGKKGKK